MGIQPNIYMIYVKRKPQYSGIQGQKNLMKPIKSLVRHNVRNLKPCVHGAEVLDAAEESGRKPEEILDFSSSVNPLGSSKKGLDAAEKAFSQIATYPDSNSNELRLAIADHFGVCRENVVVGNGSTELMYLFAETFLKKGEIALIPAPTFGEYENAVCKSGEIPKFVKFGDGFKVEANVFQREMFSAKIIFLCNPNNPTGVLIPADTLTWIVEKALEQDSLVFLDEDFLEFIENEKALSMIGKISKYPNLFVLRSFTKIYGLTGLRVGYGIANKEIIDALLCAKIPWNVNCLAQAAATAALKDEDYLHTTRELVKKEKSWLQAEFSKFCSLTFSVPDANFFFIDIRKSGLKASELKSKMLGQGILIRDCTSFRGLNEFYVRVAIKTRAENEQLIAALKKIIKAA
jgi:threonine-phosphate decarboxylase